LLSKNGFTTNALALRFLDHFIQHTNSGLDQPWKLLLVDNHGSHRAEEFAIKANANHIALLFLPPHLTHIMQPLDVGVFQPYKHWHYKAIQTALATMDFDYTIASFLRDIDGVRTLTFTKSIIKSAFRKAGMWPISLEVVQKAMKKFVQSLKTEQLKSTSQLPLPPIPHTPTTLC